MRSKKSVWILNHNQKRNNNTEEKRKKALQFIKENIYLLGRADELYEEDIRQKLLHLNKRHGIIFRDVQLNGHVYAIPLLELEDALEHFHFSISEVVEFAKSIDADKNTLLGWV